MKDKVFSIIDSNQIETDNIDCFSDYEAIKQFANFFELLDQIDKRLQKEDPEYKQMYYPEEKSNAN